MLFISVKISPSISAKKIKVMALVKTQFFGYSKKVSFLANNEFGLTKDGGHVFSCKLSVSKVVFLA